jgi:hypothetical protein
MNTRKANRVWTWPIVLGLTSAAGLISALLGDGWADALSWACLGLPVAVACACACACALRAK